MLHTNACYVAPNVVVVDDNTGKQPKTNFIVTCQLLELLPNHELWLI